MSEAPISSRTRRGREVAIYLAGKRGKISLPFQKKQKKLARAAVFFQQGKKQRRPALTIYGETKE